MSKKIEKIVGGRFKYQGKYGKIKYYSKDSTKFLKWVELDFRHGKLVKNPVSGMADSMIEPPIGGPAI